MVVIVCMILICIVVGSKIQQATLIFNLSLARYYVGPGRALFEEKLTSFVRHE